MHRGRIFIARTRAWAVDARLRALAPWVALGCALSSASGCRDVERFSSVGDHFEGTVTTGAFVRAGIEEGTRMCLTLDASSLQTTPGTLRTSDGRIRGALRPIPELWHDPLSSLTFGEGRERNLVYAIGVTADGGAEPDALAVVSLMQAATVEVRLLRGAPASDGGAEAGQAAPVFALFSLERRSGDCPF